MSWEREIDEIRRRKELAAAMGGEEAVARQHDGGKLTVRERIDGLADPGLLLRHESSGTYRHNGEVCRWIVSRLETKKKRKKKRRG